jgi:hypothetical protein
MADDRRITVRGRRYLLRFVAVREMQNKGALGECDPPDRPGKEIRILKRLRGQERLDTIIHELLHAGHWDLKEDAVNELASDIARVQTQLGYSDVGEANVSQE